MKEIIQPVVMTVHGGRTNAESNFILGENLNEFLSLGYYNGWFYLEQVCYNLKRAIEFYGIEASRKEYLNGVDSHFLGRLSTKLKFEYRSIEKERLEKLKTLYF